MVEVEGTDVGIGIGIDTGVFDGCARGGVTIGLGIGGALTLGIAAPEGIAGDGFFMKSRCSGPGFFVDSSRYVPPGVGAGTIAGDIEVFGVG